jgi:hypothetical protein
VPCYIFLPNYILTGRALKKSLSSSHLFGSFVHACARNDTKVTPKSRMCFVFFHAAAQTNALEHIIRLYGRIKIQALKAIKRRLLKSRGHKILALKRSPTQREEKFLGASSSTLKYSTSSLCGGCSPKRVPRKKITPTGAPL